MSLASLFLSLVLFPLRAKPAPPTKTKRELELEADLARRGLALDHWRELAKARGAENDRLTFALNHWRSSWHALWAENELRAQRQASADNILQNLTKLQQYQRLAFPDHCTCIPARAPIITSPKSPKC